MYDGFLNCLESVVVEVKKIYDIDVWFILMVVCYWGVEGVFDMVMKFEINFYFFVIGLGIVGDEMYWDLREFCFVFEVVWGVGFGLMVYFGEIGFNLIWVMLDVLFIICLGYGVCVIEEFDFIFCICEEGIMLENCFSLNVLFGFFLFIEVYLVVYYLEKGFNVIVSIDDLFFFDI